MEAEEQNRGNKKEALSVCSLTECYPDKSPKFRTRAYWASPLYEMRAVFCLFSHMHTQTQEDSLSQN